MAKQREKKDTPNAPTLDLSANSANNPAESVRKPKPKNLINLVSQVSEDKLKELGRAIVQWYNTDTDSKQEWDEKRARWYKLWAGSPPIKNFPWVGSSNVVVPILAGACNQFHSRAYAAFFSPPYLAKYIPTTPADEAQARRTERFMDYQLRVDVEEFEEVFDKVLLQLPISGTSFKKWWWDKDQERPACMNIGSSSLILPYNAKSLKETPRATHKLWFRGDELQDKSDNGYYDKKQHSKLTERGGNQSGDQRAEKSTVERIEEALTGDKQDFRDNDALHLVLECHLTYNLGDGRKPYIATVHHQTGTVLRLTSREFKLDGDTTTLGYFTDYHFLPNPEGYYSFGFGHFLEHLNVIYNTVTNQIIDGGTLSNMPWGFYSRRAGLKRQNIVLRPGAMNEVEDPSAVSFPQMQRMDSTLFNVLGVISQNVEKFTSVSDYLQGRDKSRPGTATGVEAIVQQGLMQFSVIVKRNFRQFAKELQLIGQLNSMYLPEEKQYFIMGNEGLPYPSIKRNDFKQRYHIMPTGDPTYAFPDQRKNDAVSLYQLMMQNPLIISNPKAVYNLTEDVFTEWGKKDLARYLPKKADDQLPPEDENFMMAKGDWHDPQEGEDHQHHMMVHTGFMTSPMYLVIPDEYKELFRKHLHATISQQGADTQKKAALGNMMSQMQAMQGGMGGGAGPMAGGPGMPQMQGGGGGPVQAGAQSPGIQEMVNQLGGPEPGFASELR